MQAHPMSQQCTATSKATRQQCRRFVIGGGPCVMHGGKAPQVAAKREARIVAHEAAQRHGPLEVRDPADALLSAAMTADELVQRLQQDLRDQAQLKPATLTALGEWLDRTGRLAKTVLDARIDERRTRVSEAQGLMFATAIRQILGALELSAQQQALVPTVVPRALRQIEGGAS